MQGGQQEFFRPLTLADIFAFYGDLALGKKGVHVRIILDYQDQRCIRRGGPRGSY